MSDDRPRTVVLTVDAPFPPVSGADLRNWRTARGAARLGPVDLISLRGDRSGPGEPVAGIAAHTLSAEPAAVIYRRPEGGSRLDLTIPVTVMQNFIANFDRTASTLIIEHPGLHRLLAAVRRPGLKLVLDLHNIESDLARQSQSWWSRRFRPARVAMVAATERAAIEAVDEVWVCSAADAARLERIQGTERRPFRIVPNAIPPASEADRDLPPALSRSSGPSLLFLGHLSYRPNVAAAEILAKRIMPRLAGALPGADLQLAGRSPHRRVKALAGERIAIIADPPDLAPLYAAAALVVVPLHVGGGTRIKIIEAMARGVPVVATRLAAEGLGVTDGAEIRLAETPRAFASAIADLWRDKSAYEAQRRLAHSHVWRHFAPERIEAAIAAAIGGEAPAGVRS